MSQSVDKSKICPKCEYDLNSLGATNCQICGTHLVDKQKPKIVKTPAITTPTNSSPKTSTPRHSEKAYTKQKLTSKTAAVELILKNQTQNWLNYVRQTSLSISQSGELKKTSNIIGLALIGLMLTLWINYLFVSPNQPEPNSTQKNQPVVPIGLFSYGGAPIFAPLVSSGMNLAIESEYRGFETRYTKPLNGDFSVEGAIKQLIDGELSFVYSDRPLTDLEYQKAQIRSFSFKSVPIAIDGIVLYTNIQTPIARLNREQVAKIFDGKISNWNQINPRIRDLPITPVAVKNDRVLGIATNSKTQYVDNYTLALRKVIATPGAISFASASLVADQQLVKMLGLADGSSTNYTRPWINGQVNLKAFKEGSYSLTRRVFLVYREDGSQDQKAAEFYTNFLKSAQGQQIIQKAGFVSIY
jgi:phosphate transport system substrate-binding protein